MSKMRALLIALCALSATAVHAGGTWDPTEPPEKFSRFTKFKVMSGKVLGVRGHGATGRTVTHMYATGLDVSQVLPLPAGPWVSVELILADGETTQLVELDGGLLRIGSIATGDAVADEDVLDAGLLQPTAWPADGEPVEFSVRFSVQ